MTEISEASKLDQRSIQPLTLLSKILGEWKLVLSISILSTLLGFGLSSILPAKYQASTVLELGIDYLRTAPMDDFVSVIAFQRVRGLLLADDTIQQAIDLFVSTGNEIESFASIQSVREQLRLSQTPDGWELVVYAHDPDDAAAFANAWGAIVLAELEEATSHALKAWEWQSALSRAHCSLAPDPVDPEKALWFCTADDERLDPSQVPSSILEEVQQTRGILPIFNFSILQKAEPSDFPILWERSTIILASAMLGLCGGILWVLRKGE